MQTLVANYARFLAFLERRVESREVAEDILQEAFVRGVDRAGSVRAEESVVAWFYRLLRNAVTDHYRRVGARERAHERVAHTDTGAEPPLDDELFTETCSCVTGLLETLKPDYADILRVVDIDGVAVREYAERRGITPNNAGVRLHRARAKLRRQVVLACRSCTEHACLDCACKSEPV